MAIPIGLYPVSEQSTVISVIELAVKDVKLKSEPETKVLVVIQFVKLSFYVVSWTLWSPFLFGENMINIQEEIIKSMDLIIKKYLHKYENTDMSGYVKAINGLKYTVTINGSDYEMKNGVGVVLTVGDPVWVHKPVGYTMKDAYIMAKK